MPPSGEFLVAWFEFLVTNTFLIWNVRGAMKPQSAQSCYVIKVQNGHVDRRRAQVKEYACTYVLCLVQWTTTFSPCERSALHRYFKKSLKRILVIEVPPHSVYLGRHWCHSLDKWIKPSPSVLHTANNQKLNSGPGNEAKFVWLSIKQNGGKVIRNVVRFE